MSSLLQETSQKAPSIESYLLPTYTNTGGKPKERPQAAFASGATLSTRSSNQAGYRLEGKGAPPRVLLPSRTYPHMGRCDPVQLVNLADSAHRWEQSHSGKSLHFLPYTVWPEKLLSLEDVGYCQQSCLDYKTGRVLCTSLGANDKE